MPKRRTPAEVDRLIEAPYPRSPLIGPDGVHCEFDYGYEFPREETRVRYKLVDGRAVRIDTS